MDSYTLAKHVVKILRSSTFEESIVALNTITGDEPVIVKEDEYDVAIYKLAQVAIILNKSGKKKGFLFEYIYDNEKQYDFVMTADLDGENKAIGGYLCSRVVREGIEEERPTESDLEPIAGILEGEEQAGGGEVLRQNPPIPGLSKLPKYSEVKEQYKSDMVSSYNEGAIIFLSPEEQPYLAGICSSTHIDMNSITSMLLHSYTQEEFKNELIARMLMLLLYGLMEKEISAVTVLYTKKSVSFSFKSDKKINNDDLFVLSSPFDVKLTNTTNGFVYSCSLKSSSHEDIKIPKPDLHNIDDYLIICAYIAMSTWKNDADKFELLEIDEKKFNESVKKIAKLVVSDKKDKKEKEEKEVIGSLPEVPKEKGSKKEPKVKDDLDLLKFNKSNLKDFNIVFYPSTNKISFIGTTSDVKNFIKNSYLYSSVGLIPINEFSSIFNLGYGTEAIFGWTTKGNGKIDIKNKENIKTLKAIANEALNKGINVSVFGMKLYSDVAKTSKVNQTTSDICEIFKSFSKPSYIGKWICEKYDPSKNSSMNMYFEGVEKGSADEGSFKVNLLLREDVGTSPIYSTVNNIKMFYTIMKNDDDGSFSIMRGVTYIINDVLVSFNYKDKEYIKFADKGLIIENTDSDETVHDKIWSDFADHAKFIIANCDTDSFKSQYSFGFAKKLETILVSRWKANGLADRYNVYSVNQLALPYAEMLVSVKDDSKGYSFNIKYIIAATIKLIDGCYAVSRINEHGNELLVANVSKSTESLLNNKSLILKDFSTHIDMSISNLEDKFIDELKAKSSPKDKAKTAPAVVSSPTVVSPVTSGTKLVIIPPVADIPEMEESPSANERLSNLCDLLLSLGYGSDLVDNSIKINSFMRNEISGKYIKDNVGAEIAGGKGTSKGKAIFYLKIMQLTDVENRHVLAVYGKNDPDSTPLFVSEPYDIEKVGKKELSSAIGEFEALQLIYHGFTPHSENSSKDFDSYVELLLETLKEENSVTYNEETEEYEDDDDNGESSYNVEKERLNNFLSTIIVDLKFIFKGLLNLDIDDKMHYAGQNYKDFFSFVLDGQGEEIRCYCGNERLIASLITNGNQTKIALNIEGPFKYGTEDKYLHIKTSNFSIDMMSETSTFMAMELFYAISGIFDFEKIIDESSFLVAAKPVASAKPEKTAKEINTFTGFDDKIFVETIRVLLAAHHLGEVKLHKDYYPKISTENADKVYSKYYITISNETCVSGSIDTNNGKLKIENFDSDIKIKLYQRLSVRNTIRVEAEYSTGGTPVNNLCKSFSADKYNSKSKDEQYEFIKKINIEILIVTGARNISYSNYKTLSSVGYPKITDEVFDKLMNDVELKADSIIDEEYFMEFDKNKLSIKINKKDTGVKLVSYNLDFVDGGLFLKVGEYGAYRISSIKDDPTPFLLDLNDRVTYDIVLGDPASASTESTPTVDPEKRIKIPDSFDCVVFMSTLKLLFKANGFIAIESKVDTGYASRRLSFDAFSHCASVYVKDSATKSRLRIDTLSSNFEIYLYSKQKNPKEIIVAETYNDENIFSFDSGSVNGELYKNIFVSAIEMSGIRPNNYCPTGFSPSSNSEINNSFYDTFDKNMHELAKKSVHTLDSKYDLSYVVEVTPVKVNRYFLVSDSGSGAGIEKLPVSIGNYKMSMSLGDYAYYNIDRVVKDPEIFIIDINCKIKNDALFGVKPSLPPVAVPVPASSSHHSAIHHSAMSGSITSKLEVYKSVIETLKSNGFDVNEYHAAASGEAVDDIKVINSVSEESDHISINIGSNVSVSSNYILHYMWTPGLKIGNSPNVEDSTIGPIIEGGKAPSEYEVMLPIWYAGIFPAGSKPPAGNPSSTQCVKYFNDTIPSYPNLAYIVSSKDKYINFLKSVAKFMNIISQEKLDISISATKGASIKVSVENGTKNIIVEFYFKFDTKYENMTYCYSKDGNPEASTTSIVLKCSKANANANQIGAQLFRSLRYIIKLHTNLSTKKDLKIDSIKNIYTKYKDVYIGSTAPVVATSPIVMPPITPVVASPSGMLNKDFIVNSFKKFGFNETYGRYEEVSYPYKLGVLEYFKVKIDTSGKSDEFSLHYTVNTHGEFGLFGKDLLQAVGSNDFKISFGNKKSFEAKGTDYMMDAITLPIRMLGIFPSNTCKVKDIVVTTNKLIETSSLDEQLSDIAYCLDLIIGNDVDSSTVSDYIQLFIKHNENDYLFKVSFAFESDSKFTMIIYSPTTSASPVSMKVNFPYEFNVAEINKVRTQISNLLFASIRKWLFIYTSSEPVKYIYQRPLQESVELYSGSMYTNMYHQSFELLTSVTSAPVITSETIPASAYSSASAAFNDETIVSAFKAFGFKESDIEKNVFIDTKYSLFETIKVEQFKATEFVNPNEDLKVMYAIKSSGAVGTLGAFYHTSLDAHAFVIDFGKKSSVATKSLLYKSHFITLPMRLIGICPADSVSSNDTEVTTEAITDIQSGSILEYLNDVSKYLKIIFECEAKVYNGTHSVENIKPYIELTVKYESVTYGFNIIPVFKTKKEFSFIIKNISGSEILDLSKKFSVKHSGDIKTQVALLIFSRIRKNINADSGSPNFIPQRKIEESIALHKVLFNFLPEKNPFISESATAAPVSPPVAAPVIPPPVAASSSSTKTTAAIAEDPSKYYKYNNSSYQNTIKPFAGYVTTINEIADRLERIGGKPGGQMKGGIYKDPVTGSKYMVKHFEDSKSEFLKCELFAAHVYRYFGLNVPDSRVASVKNKEGVNKLSLISPFIEGLKFFKKGEIPESALTEFAKQVPVDIVMANYDVAGLLSDNIGYTVNDAGKATIYRVDVGASLFYRSDGRFKTNMINLDPSKDYEYMLYSPTDKENIKNLRVIFEKAITNPGLMLSTFQQKASFTETTNINHILDWTKFDFNSLVYNSEALSKVINTPSPISSSLKINGIPCILPKFILTRANRLIELIKVKASSATVVPVTSGGVVSSAISQNIKVAKKGFKNIDDDSVTSYSAIPVTSFAHAPVPSSAVIEPAMAAAYSSSAPVVASAVENNKDLGAFEKIQFDISKLDSSHYESVSNEFKNLIKITQELLKLGANAHALRLKIKNKKGAPSVYMFDCLYFTCYDLHTGEFAPEHLGLLFYYGKAYIVSINKCNSSEKDLFDISDGETATSEFKNIFGYEYATGPMSHVGEIIESDDKYKSTDYEFPSILAKFNNLLITSGEFSILDPSKTVLTAGHDDASKLDLFVDGARLVAPPTTDSAPVPASTEPIPVSIDILTSSDPADIKEIEEEIETRSLDDHELILENVVDNAFRSKYDWINFESSYVIADHSDIDSKRFRLKILTEEQKMNVAVNYSELSELDAKSAIAVVMSRMVIFYYKEADDTWKILGKNPESEDDIPDSFESSYDLCSRYYKSIIYIMVNGEEDDINLDDYHKSLEKSFKEEFSNVLKIESKTKVDVIQIHEDFDRITKLAGIVLKSELEDSNKIKLKCYTVRESDLEETEVINADITITEDCMFLVGKNILTGLTETYNEQFLSQGIVSTFRVIDSLLRLCRDCKVIAVDASNIKQIGNAGFADGVNKNDVVSEFRDYATDAMSYYFISTDKDGSIHGLLKSNDYEALIETEDKKIKIKISDIDGITLKSKKFNPLTGFQIFGTVFIMMGCAKLSVSCGINSQPAIDAGKIAELISSEMAKSGMVKHGIAVIDSFTVRATYTLPASKSNNAVDFDITVLPGRKYRRFNIIISDKKSNTIISRLRITDKKKLIIKKVPIVATNILTIIKDRIASTYNFEPIKLGEKIENINGVIGANEISLFLIVNSKEKKFSVLPSYEFIKRCAKGEIFEGFNDNKDMFATLVFDADACTLKGFHAMYAVTNVTQKIKEIMESKGLEQYTLNF